MYVHNVTWQTPCYVDYGAVDANEWLYWYIFTMNRSYTISSANAGVLPFSSKVSLKRNSIYKFFF